MPEKFVDTGELDFKHSRLHFLIVHLFEAICDEYSDKSINKMDKTRGPLVTTLT